MYVCMYIYIGLPFNAASSHLAIKTSASSLLFVVSAIFRSACHWTLLLLTMYRCMKCVEMYALVAYACMLGLPGWIFILLASSLRAGSPLWTTWRCARRRAWSRLRVPSTTIEFYIPGLLLLTPNRRIRNIDIIQHQCSRTTEYCTHTHADYSMLTAEF